jgi:hypothetical protein
LAAQGDAKKLSPLLSTGAASSLIDFTTYWDYDVANHDSQHYLLTLVEQSATRAASDSTPSHHERKRAVTYVRTVRDWVTLKDYDNARERATDEIVERLSRGNTLAQDGGSMEQDELDRMSLAADAAMLKMAHRVP